jgi:hypothetical protein
MVKRLCDGTETGWLSVLAAHVNTYEENRALCHNKPLRKQSAAPAIFHRKLQTTF